MWHIARSVLESRRERPVADLDVGAYWMELVQANRAVLVHPDDPSLIYAGQVLVLPPLSH